MSQKSDKPRGVFDDFSFSAVAASALTAATSFLLTSKIGLAGSLIGAMAAAVISTVSTQVYKGMLTASAERIKEVAEPTIAFGQHVSSETHLGHASTHEIGRFARRLAVFAACVSLVAVLASAAVIAFATRGAGLGPTTWEPVAVVEEAKETASEVKEDAAAVADKVESKVENKVDELVEEATTQAQATTDDTSAETETPTEETTDDAQPSVVPEAPEQTAEEPAAPEPAAEQEQPLAEQGLLQESEAASSADVAQ